MTNKMDGQNRPTRNSSVKDRVSQWQSRNSEVNEENTQSFASPTATRKKKSSFASPQPPSLRSSKSEGAKAPPRKSQEDGRPPRSSSVQDSSGVGSMGLNDSSKSPKVLQKKIDKVQDMMKEVQEAEKKGRDSKKFKRLSEKLEQYQLELAGIEQDEPETPEIQPKKKLSKSSNDILAAAKYSPGPDTPKCNPQMLQRKIQKVNKLLSTNTVGSKDYQKLVKKRESYKMALEEFDGRMKVQAKVENPLPSIPLMEDNEEEEVQPTEAKTLPKTKTVTPKIIQKKLDKVEKMMSELEDKLGTSAFASKEYKKLMKKQEEYSSALEDFEGRMKLKALATTTPPKQPEPPTSVTTDEVVADDFKRPPLTRRKSSKIPRRSQKVSAPRLRELDTHFKPEVFAKDASDEQIIRKEIRNNFIFKKVRDRALEELVQAFEPIPAYSPGDAIVQQGDEGEYFYFIRSGSVDYEVNGKKVGSAEAGSTFGELSLLYSCPRKATVRANSEADLYRVDQITFRYILQSQFKFKLLFQSAVRKVITMNRLLPGGINAVRVSIVESTELQADMRPTVTRDSAMCQSLDMDDIFEDETGQDEEDNFAFVGEHSQKRISLQQSFSDRRVSLEDFNRSSVLGEGQFGEVWLVHADLDDLKDAKDRNFALKIQSKEDIERECNSNMKISVAEAIQRECDVLSQLSHPFICEFVHQFEDDDNIYLVMGVITGVELWSVIHSENDDGEWESGIPESNAKFYALLMADTLNFMHRQQICYRDLKAENIMINETGYPVFVDFGFAKYLPEGKTFTYCGTPAYTCPEIISNEGHGYAADHWALGVLVYEMISGESPFYWEGISDLQLLQDICNEEPAPLAEDGGYSSEVKDLISRLLIKDPLERLGSLAQGGKEVTGHPWFAELNLAKLRLQELPAPFIPTLEED